jgi:prepilin-type N-terminal cleavage/methylation domain-containing protein
VMQTSTTAMSRNGFTILELVISLFVIALLLASALTPLQTQVEERKIDETRRLLEHVQEALLGYAAANGYFPCPADASSKGQEATGTNHNTGSCPLWHGFLPAAALGLTPADAQGYAIDAWGGAANRIRYAVSSQTLAGLAYPFTRTNGLRSVPMGALAAAPMLYVCESAIGVNPGTDCGTAVTRASNAAVVVWSSGANAINGGVSIHESENPHVNGGSADRIFVSRIRSNVSGSEFDDILTWIPATALLSRLIVAGQFTPAALSAASPPR